MDDELHNLEAELTRLRPAPLSPELHRKLAAQLPPASARVARRRWWLAALTLPAAAAVALLATRFSPAPPAGRPAAPGAVIATSNLLKPVAVENVLYAATDEGLITLDDGTPARRERLHYIDTITWRNSRTHASLTWTVPREEVRVVPLRYH